MLNPFPGTFPATVKDYGLATIGKDEDEKEYAFIDFAVHFQGVDTENPLGPVEPFDHTFRWQGWLHTKKGRDVAFGGLVAAGLRKLDDLPRMADGIASGALDPKARAVVTIVPDDYRGDGHFKISFVNDADAPPPTKKLAKAEATKRLMASGALGELGLYFVDHGNGISKPSLTPGKEGAKLAVDKIDL
jgi:hypothetical protein